MGDVPKELLGRFAQLEPAMLNWAAMLCGEDALAEDAVQEAFLRAIRHAGRFDGRSDLKTWLLTITRRCCYDLLKRRRKRRTVDADLAGRPDGTDGPDAPAETADELDRLRRHVDALPAEQREVFVLHHVFEMPHQRIAEVVAAPLGTVKSRLHHAVAKLRAALLQK